jgi:DNA modification methylase
VPQASGVTESGQAWFGLACPHASESTGILPMSESPGPALDSAEIDDIATRLRAGEFLPDDWRDKLFARQKEAELSYAGKEPRGVILARTMGVPLQVLKRFGSDGDWMNKLIFGDNLQILKTLLDMKSRGELRNADGSRGVRLCYIDPPFATKREFRGKRGQMAYRDKVEGAEFIEFLRKRLIFIHELLADDGVLYLHLDTKKVHYMKVVLDELFGEAGFHNEIIWKRSDAHSDTIQGAQDYGRIHDTILRYTKGGSAVFNTQYLPLPDSTAESWYRNVEEGTGRRYNNADLTAAKPGGDTSYEFNGVRPPPGRYWAYSKAKMQEFRREGRLTYAKSGRPYMKRYLDESRGVPLQDLWTDIAMLRGISTDGERAGYPTQKPIALLKRIIEVSSNPGDLVLDCFGGSGTTAVAAQHLGRRWIAVDCGKLAIYKTQQRLLTMTEGKGRRKRRRPAAPFELCHAGLYDNDLLEQLNFTAFEAFALELFGCVPQRQTIAGVPMSGTRKGGPVHVFPFNKTKAEMGIEYIDSLHERIGSKVSGAVYVIVPVAHCDPGLFEDVISRGSTTYFVLRVPYSVIEALHDREFKLIGQPTSIREVNDALDSFGFDFMQPPEVKTKQHRRNGRLELTIKEFHRGGLDPDDVPGLEDHGRGDLAMVMIDRDWDGDALSLDEWEFADSLAENDWRLCLDTDGSERLLVVFLDVYGNEARHVIEAKAKPRAGRSTTAARTTTRPTRRPKR